MDVPYTYVKTDDEILGALQEFSRAPLIATDTETTGLDPHTDKLLLWQFSNGQKNVVINCIAENAISRKDETSPVYRLLKDICVKKDYLKMGHNIGFDFKMIKKNLGFEMENLYDTMIAEKVLIAGKDIPSNRYQPLKVVAPKYANLTEREMKKEIRAGFYSGYVINEFTEDQLEYSARDVQVLHSIYWGQIHQIQQDGLDRVAQLEFDIIPAVAMMEYHGVNMDVPYWRSLLAEAEAKMVELRKEIQFYLKPLAKQKSIFDEFCEISMDSPTQLAVALRDLGLNVESTGADILEKISGSHPILKPLLNYRELNRFVKAYGEGLLGKISRVTGRIHGHFQSCSTSTLRFSSNTPNLQNIPAAGKYRRGFIAPEGYYCLGGDFSSQEMKILAYLSQEPNMLDALRKGRDLHHQTTCQIYGITYEKLDAILKSIEQKQQENRFNEITDEEREWKEKRKISKSCNFLIGYGGSYKRLSAVANIEEDRAKEIISKFFVGYPALKKYIEREGNKSIELGYSTAILGNRRYYTLPPTSDPDYQKIAAAVKRQATNQTIQGSAAMMTKLALKLIYERFASKFGNDNAYLWAAIHDEAQCMVKKEIVEEAFKVVEDSMTDAFYALIPKDVCPAGSTVQYGDCWLH